MKIATIILTTFLFTLSPDWLTDFESAKHEAKQSNKMILLNFSGSDWCAPCIKMKKDIFEQAPFLEYANQNLVLVRADFPRSKKNQLDPKLKSHNEKLAEQYNPQGKFPLTLLLDINGNVIRTWDGLPGESVESFIQQVDKNIHGN